MDEKMNKHKIISFLLDDGRTLLYHDVRKFGKMKLLSKNNYLEDEALAKLGKEPFFIKKEELFNKIKASNKAIKELILDQTNMAGLGNIYADEVLFLSKLNPLKKGKEISIVECQSIIDNSVIVLNKAIKAGGSTIRSYHSGNNVDGKFQNQLNVYGKKGDKCPVCNSCIEKIVVGGRGTHYCPHCQK
jgi:formamidopyrimidine-DNA glycosylase